MKYLLDQIGLEPQRVRMFNISSAMAATFATAAIEMTEQVQALGPSPLRKKPVQHEDGSDIKPAVEPAQTLGEQL